MATKILKSIRNLRHGIILKKDLSGGDSGQEGVGFWIVEDDFVVS